MPHPSLVTLPLQSLPKASLESTSFQSDVVVKAALGKDASIDTICQDIGTQAFCLDCLGKASLPASGDFLHHLHSEGDCKMCRRHCLENIGPNLSTTAEQCGMCVVGGSAAALAEVLQQPGFKDTYGPGLHETGSPSRDVGGGGGSR